MSENNFKAKANALFAFIVIVGLIFSAAMFRLALKYIPTFGNFLTSARHGLDALCGCGAHLSFSTHPYIWSGLLAVGIIISGFFVAAGARGLGYFFRNRKYLKSRLARAVKPAGKLSRAARALTLEDKVRLAPSAAVEAFCCGFWRPKIYVSGGLAARLNLTELVSVLSHEKQHLLSRDPLKIFIANLARKIFFFVPGLKSLVKRFSLYSELSADARATAGFKNKIYLASALLKIIKTKENFAWQTPFEALPLSGFANLTGERISQLADGKIARHRLAPIKSFFLFFGAAGTLIVLTFVPMLLRADWLDRTAKETCSAFSHTHETHAASKSCAQSSRYVATNP
ncbi:M56 family peptidase [Patescibacteria group bacterium]|nr:MAG: M56 family peptidase [Patescibacteria group bacterium]